MLSFNTISAAPIGASAAFVKSTFVVAGGAVCGGTSMQTSAAAVLPSGGGVAGGNAPLSVSVTGSGQATAGGISPHGFTGDVINIVYYELNLSMSDTTKRFIMTEV